MSDEITNGKSKEEIAYRLFLHVADVEGKSLKRSVGMATYEGDRLATRQYILDTYEECLKAVRNRPYPGKTTTHGVG